MWGPHGNFVQRRKHGPTLGFLKCESWVWGYVFMWHGKGILFYFSVIYFILFFFLGGDILNWMKHNVFDILPKIYFYRNNIALRDS